MKRPRKELSLEKGQTLKKNAKAIDVDDIVTLPVRAFQRIIRHIAKHDMPPAQAEWFTSANRASLRRLAKLGVAGHQASIRVHVQMSHEEKKNELLKASSVKKLEYLLRSLKKLKLSKTRKPRESFGRHKAQNPKDCHDGAR